MTSLKDLEERLNNIESRNRKVEADKSWELSYTRRLLIVIFTYLAIGFYLQYINIVNAWLNAIIPTIAFLLSMLTLPFFKKIWLTYFYKK